MKLTVAQLEKITSAETHALIGGFLLFILAVYFPGNLVAVALVFSALFLTHRPV